MPPIVKLIFVMGGMLAVTFLAVFFLPFFFKLLIDRRLKTKAEDFKKPEVEEKTH